MTLGELKVNCYKLIDPSDLEIFPENIVDIYEKDTTYSFYFLNMLNSINSAITRVVQSCSLPLKRVEIEYPINTLETDKKRLEIDLKKYTTDVYKIKLIEYEDKNGNANKIFYRLIGDFLKVQPQSEGKIIIYYYPKINTIENYFNQQKDLNNINDLNMNDLGLDDNILSIIPYYVKADLLEHDKPNEAILARNTFEQYLANFETQEIITHEQQKSWWRSIL